MERSHKITQDMLAAAVTGDGLKQPLTGEGHDPAGGLLRSAGVAAFRSRAGQMPPYTDADIEGVRSDLLINEALVTLIEASEDPVMLRDLVAYNIVRGHMPEKTFDPGRYVSEKDFWHLRKLLWLGPDKLKRFIISGHDFSGATVRAADIGGQNDDSELLYMRQCIMQQVRMTDITMQRLILCRLTFLTLC
ncbi:MAG: hypothetical protein TR69_WS6001000727 [candidate division WS6 bacterium OLB20]|uniref:Uncharacterized protein n=1 Tax=candidate division WS6 bacterium OLB20 TaxID=1617426 RepID=A0A136LYJ4_9BACT|nr:MAG: hypothetical protein TR69_WS6001000727 [candidate division WS6 bacterium OLB20]